MSQPQPPNTPLLQIADLNKVFDIRQGFSSIDFHAVDDATLSLDNDKPEIFTIAGESGSGKTTLARMILGMEKPSDGRTALQGAQHRRTEQQRKASWFFKEVQPVFQDPFAAFSPLKRIDHYLYETVYNYKIS